MNLVKDPAKKTIRVRRLGVGEQGQSDDNPQSPSKWKKGTLVSLLTRDAAILGIYELTDGMPNDKKDDRFRKLKEYLTKPYEEQAEDRSRYYVQGIKIWPHVENDVSNLDTHLLYTLANPLPEDHPGRDYFDPATGRVMSTLVSDTRWVGDAHGGGVVMAPWIFDAPPGTGTPDSMVSGKEGLTCSMIYLGMNPDPECYGLNFGVTRHRRMLDSQPGFIVSAPEIMLARGCGEHGEHGESNLRLHPPPLKHSPTFIDYGRQHRVGITNSRQAACGGIQSIADISTQSTRRLTAPTKVNHSYCKKSFSTTAIQSVIDARHANDQSEPPRGVLATIAPTPRRSTGSTQDDTHDHTHDVLAEGAVESESGVNNWRYHAINSLNPRPFRKAALGASSLAEPPLKKRAKITAAAHW